MKLFGTDGIRGRANGFLSPSLAFAVGKAACAIVSEGFERQPKIVIANDTRISADMLESSLASGIMSAGGIAVMAGVAPTPAMTSLIAWHNAQAGIVVSASHNPYFDNGIKIFTSDGLKLSDSYENRIEELVKNLDLLPNAVDNKIGSIIRCLFTKDIYISAIAKSMSHSRLDGIKVVLDCANGATSAYAEAVFQKYGATTHMINNLPNGININGKCGSTDIASLTEAVLAKGADVGFAFDGDGDRVVAVDGSGRELDGDEAMYLVATSLKKKGLLAGDKVVATILSNGGLATSLKKQGITLLRSQVGDRYVLEEMIKENAVFGGEKSGHMIYWPANSTGDGINSALMLCSIMAERQASLLDCLEEFVLLPQVQKTARIDKSNPEAYMGSNDCMGLIESMKEKYSNSGRIVIRASGTEPLVRVMIEGEDEEQISKDADVVVMAIEGAAGTADTALF
ncbi:MAG: phosphoglucosamine mutase [Eubacteriaceae bacterium]|nr:phosphoglucosamine mutase [Eubacteriaceae bacterium]